MNDQRYFGDAKKPNMVINYIKNHPTMISSIAGAAVGAGGSIILAKKKAKKLGLKPGTKEYKKFMAKYIAAGTGVGLGSGYLAGNAAGSLIIANRLKGMNKYKDSKFLDRLKKGSMIQLRKQLRPIKHLLGIKRTKDNKNMSSIVFDEDTRVYSVINDQKYFGIFKNTLSDVVTPAARGLGAGLGRNLREIGSGPKATLWGAITGRNKQIRRQEEAKQARALARIAAGTDTRSMLADQLGAMNKAKMAKISQRPELARIKYGYKGKKVDAKSKLPLSRLDANLEMAKLNHKAKQDEGERSLRGSKELHEYQLNSQKIGNNKLKQLR